MMITNKLLKLRWLTIVVLMLFALSCGKSDKVTPDDNGGDGGNNNEDVIPSITAISITNAGANGDKTVDGTVDEDAKSINFTDVDPETDLAAVKFDATIDPDGATLEKDSYDFGFEAGDAKKTISVKVVNGSKSKEYLVTVQLAVPIYGANFDEAEVFDFTAVTDNLYPDFTSSNVRGSGFDGENVLIVNHSTGPFLLSVDNIMDGSGAPTPIPLDLTGVAGGTYPTCAGYQVNGHSYATSLQGGTASRFKIYHWTDPNTAPDVILDVEASAYFGSTDNRYGDYMSVSLDANGNGYMYFGSRDPANHGFGRVTVASYTTISDPTYYLYPDDAYQVLTYMIAVNRVGNTDNYLVKGYDSKLYVTDASGNVANASFSLTAGSLPVGLSDPRVVDFNNKRYLIGATTWRHETGENTLYVYDISKGDDIIEALTNFDTITVKEPVYKYSLQGGKTIAPGTRTGFHIVKDGQGNDESLLLYAAGTDVGFVVIKVPKAE